MIKMFIVLLSIVFAVAACNKNNSKADRAKKLQDQQQQQQANDGKNKQNPSADQGGAKGGTGTPDAGKGADQNEGKGNTDGNVSGDSTNNVPPALTSSGSNDVAGKPGGDSSSTSAGAASSVVNLPNATSAVSQKGTETTKSKVEKTEIPSMNLYVSEMETVAEKNSVYLQGILEANRDRSLKTIVYCYDPQKSKDLRRDNSVPEIYMYPNSELLVGIGKAEKPVNDVAIGPVQENRVEYKFMQGICKGNSYDISSDNTIYDVIKLKANETRTDYLRLEEGVVEGANKVKTERDMAEISVLCSNDSNINAKMDLQKDETTNTVKNRLTLSAGSKIMFARATNYRLKDNKTLKESKNLKDYAIISCE